MVEASAVSSYTPEWRGSSWRDARDAVARGESAGYERLSHPLRAGDSAAGLSDGAPQLPLIRRRRGEGRGFC